MLSTNSLATGVCVSARVSEFSRASANIERAGGKEQRTCIKFCFKLNKTAAETHRMLKEAFGEQALSQARTFEWFKCFKDSRESMENDKWIDRRTRVQHGRQRNTHSTLRHSCRCSRGSVSPFRCNQRYTSFRSLIHAFSLVYPRFECPRAFTYIDAALI